MLLHPILVLSLIPHPTSAQPAESSTSTTDGPLLLPSGGSGRGSDTGNVGSAVGGASAAAVAVLMIALAFAMLRWSRRQNCLYHNNELGEVVPSLSYRKRSADVETASVDSFESDSGQLQLPAPALLPAAPHKVNTGAVMRETRPEEPPIYSPPTSAPARPSSSNRSSPWPI